MKAEYDYIILGAGSAGCVLANRLSESGEHSVLVVEAGPMDNKLLIHIPAGVSSVYKDPSINWNYESEAEPDLVQRHIELPRGKVLGGSSSINAMVYMRGHPRDYDRWNDELGLDGWRYADCLPYFRAGETSERGESEWRGGSGPLGVARAKLENPLFDAFLQAGKSAGQGYSEDLNGFQPEGVARLDSTIRDGRRCSAAVAHLKPALSRSNLELVTHTLVEQVLLEHNAARGVRLNHRGERHSVQARREVILACGAIKSPQLLMLSGIGPAAELSKHDIPLRHELPGVGRNLQDHLKIHCTWHCTRPITCQECHALHRLVKRLALENGLLVICLRDHPFIVGKGSFEDSANEFTTPELEAQVMLASQKDDVAFIVEAQQLLQRFARYQNSFGGLVD